MSRSYRADNVGIIPYDEYFRKIEQMDLPEDPNVVEKYLRSNLVDYRPDAPMFESDQPRDPSDRGSGNGSGERLNLRHSGGRSTETPYLPDGTFLDHEFMERDPRGTQNLPDFAAARKQKEARGKFIKFYNDDDMSVPETGINPVQMVSLIRGAQKQFKERFRNFEESADGWHNGSAVRRGKTSVVAMVTADGTIADLNDVTAKQRQDPVNLLSKNVLGVPRHTSQDQRVKISKYGVTRPGKDAKSDNWNNNRENVYLDHQVPVEIGGQMVNRMLAHMILDVEGQRMSKQIAAQGADYNESEVTQLRESRKRVNPVDLYKAIMIGLTSASQSASANQEFFENKTSRNNAAKPNINLRTVIDAGQINHEVAASMVQATKSIGKQLIKDARNSIIASAADNNIYRNNSNRSSARTSVDNRLERNSLDDRHIDEALETKQYGRIKPAAERLTYENSDFEDFGSVSKGNVIGARKITKYKNRSKSDVESDANMDEFALPSRRNVLDAKPGRSIQADFGDSERSESESATNIQRTLENMIGFN